MDQRSRPTIRPPLLDRAVVIYGAVVVRYGRTKHERRKLNAEGFLPCYSVDDEETAERLLVLCCRLDPDGSFIAQELAEGNEPPEGLRQRGHRLINLRMFGERLRTAHENLAAIDRRTARERNCSKGIDRPNIRARSDRKQREDT